MIVLTYKQNCINNMARKNVGYHSGLYWLDGKSYTKEEFDKAFPKANKLINENEVKKFKGENPDKQHNFFFDGKSY